MPPFTAINTPITRSAVAVPLTSQSPSAAPSTSDIPICVTPEISSDGKRKSPTQDKELPALTKAVKRLKRQFIAGGGNVKMPLGLSSNNSVIVNIRKNVLPDAQSRQGMDYEDDELDFMIHAAGWVKGAKSNWQHKDTAAYVGRTCQAVRVAVCHMREKRAKEERREARRAEEQGLQQNLANTRDSLEEEEAITTPHATPSMTDCQSGSPRSSTLGSSNRQEVNTSHGSQLIDPSSVCLPSIEEWYSKERPGVENIAPEDEARVKRMDEVLLLLPLSKFRSYEGMAQAEADRQAARSTQTLSTESTTGLDMLADAAQAASSDSSHASSALGPTAGNDQRGGSTEQQLPRPSGLVLYTSEEDEE
ncbi:hypothetical protein E4T39_02289 [Aureobasidium subglaciale]|nr:hypothetical protein E4T39_02289 [Aureobasidium subglaciale]